MAKCKQCGRGGLFTKLEPSGLCQECEALLILGHQRNNIESHIEELTAKLVNCEAESIEEIPDSVDLSDEEDEAILA